MSNLTIITPNFAVPAVDITRLQKSCAYHDLNLVTYGDGQSWPGYGVAKIQHALEAVKHVETDYVMHVDSTDVVILGDASAIIDKYIRGVQSYGLIPSKWPRVLISGEVNCWPDVSISNLYNRTVSSWRYPNAGGWMGEVPYVRSVLEAMVVYGFVNQWAGDDQRIWHEWITQKYEYLPVQVDDQCNLFQCMGGKNDSIAVTDEWVCNLDWDTHPIVIHFNGRTPGIDQFKYFMEEA